MASDREEVKRRARRLLVDRGRQYSGAAGYTHGADGYGMVVVADGSWWCVHFRDSPVGLNKIVLKANSDTDEEWADDITVAEALRRLTLGQVLDDLSEIEKED